MLASALVTVVALSFAAHPTPNPVLLQVKAVYVLPMGYSLDQFLMSNLTQLGVFKVVTDPQKADAVFTDRVDATFKQRM